MADERHRQRTELASMTAEWRDQPLVTDPASPQAALDTAQAAVPSMEPAFLGFPGSFFTTPYHYVVFMRGDTSPSWKAWQRRDDGHLEVAGRSLGPHDLRPPHRAADSRVRTS